MRGRGEGGQVFLITGARRGLTDDVEARQRRYVVSMSVRTVCFVLAVVADGPLRLVLIVAAVVVPYVAVVLANGGREKPGRGPNVFDAGRGELPGPRGEAGA